MPRSLSPLCIVIVAVVCASVAGCKRQETAQWTRTRPPQALPIGVGATRDFGTTPTPLVGPAVASWSESAAVAWLGGSTGTVTLMVATSSDAGRTFDTHAVSVLGPLDEAISSGRLDLSVDVPANDAAAPPRLDVRWSPRGGTPRTWSASWPGLAIAESSADTTKYARFRWRVAAGSNPASIALTPPPALAYVGVQPVAAVANGVLRDEAVLLDNHGALGTLWRVERGAGPQLLLSRYYVDWEGGKRQPLAFGPPILVTDGEIVELPTVAPVPGGLIVAWVAFPARTPPTIQARLVGLDMTCSAPWARPKTS